MRKIITILFLAFFCSVYSQKDSLNIGDSYREDQLYFNVTYNSFKKQPKALSSTSFSYGLGLGYIRDVPFNKQANLALGLGLGYGYDSFNHGLNVSNDMGNTIFSIANEVNSNTLKLHSLQVPIQLRWRSSNAVKYSFWRIYAGVNLKYNLKNKFVNETNKLTNIDNFRKLLTDITISAGYGTFNLYISYSLQPIFKDAFLQNEKINTKMLRVGFSFYFL